MSKFLSVIFIGFAQPVHSLATLVFLPTHWGHLSICGAVALSDVCWPGPPITFLDIISTPRLVGHGLCSTETARRGRTSTAKNDLEPCCHCVDDRL